MALDWSQYPIQDFRSNLGGADVLSGARQFASGGGLPKGGMTALGSMLGPIGTGVGAALDVGGAIYSAYQQKKKEEEEQRLMDAAIAEDKRRYKKNFGEDQRQAYQRAQAGGLNYLSGMADTAMANGRRGY